MRVWDRFIHPISRIARRKRARQILEIFPSFNAATVLDVGGSRHYWEKMQGILEPQSLKIINIGDNGQSVSETGGKSKFSIELYDGVTLPYANQSFDIVMCNSVIEHVALDARRALVEEIRRVGRSYIIQTPAQSFPIEPHFVTPFIHWLPRRLGRIASILTVYAMLTRASKTHIYAYFDEIRLLTKSELLGYAPEARLVRERVLGLTKSFTIVGWSGGGC